MRFEHLIITIVAFWSASVTHNEHNSSVATDLNDLGINYRQIELTDPTPNKIHIVSINLALNRVKPKVVLGKDSDGDGYSDAIDAINKGEGFLSESSSWKRL